MQKHINEIFDFSFILPLAYMQDNIEEITEELHKDGIFVFSVLRDTFNPFFISVQEQLYKEDPSYKIKLIILGIRYNKEYTA